MKTYLDNWIRRIFTSSWLYAVFYVALIPAFAIIYSFDKGGFYHSTIRYEANTLNLVLDVEREIKKALRSAVNRKLENPYIKIFDLVIETQTALLSPNVRTSFRIALDQQFIAGVNGKMESISSRWMTISFTHTVRGEQRFAPIWDAKFNSVSDYDLAREMFTPLYTNDKLTAYFVASRHRELSESLDAYAEAFRGVPRDGNFGRMLYLSAATITTLGYGDIVPISDRSRFLVGLQAVSGVVLIGLFLTFLGFQKAGRRD